MKTTEQVLRDVGLERQRQNIKWGYPQVNDPFQWVSILLEEVGELAMAINDTYIGKNPNGNVSQVLREAIQVAAVAVSIVEHLDGGIPR